jgi:hypothetical protein
MPRKKKDAETQIVAAEPQQPVEDRRKNGDRNRKRVKAEGGRLDDPISYALNWGHAADLTATQEEKLAWKKTQPILTVDQLKNVYVADGNMTIDKMADKINAVSIEKNGNARYANFVLAIAAIGRNADLSNIDDLRMRFYSYLELSQRCNMKISNLCAYLSIGMTYSKAYNQMKNGSDPVKDLLFEIQAVCGSYRESITSDGKLNPVTSIFWQKNYDDLKDRSEQTVTVHDPLGVAKSVEDIKQKYADIILD